MADRNAFEQHCWQGLYPEEIYDIYAPYQRETQIKGRTALLMIDLYQLCFAGGDRPVRELLADYPSSCGEHAWAALPAIQQVLAATRSAELPVLYSTKDQRNAGASTGVKATHRKPGADSTTKAYAIQPELAPVDGELMIHKERASCFFGTPLVTYLQKLKVETLLVCGESTSGCVRATVVDAYSYGFHTVVVEEGVFDRNPIAHRANLFDLHHKYADVMSVQEVLDHLESLRSRP